MSMQISCMISAEVAEWYYVGDSALVAHYIENIHGFLSP
jgi:hypothetical protein